MTKENQTGRARGGFARAAKLTPEKRSEIASEAAKARWAEREESIIPKDALPSVLEGYSNVLDLAGTKLPCAVISGPDGILRVLTEHGITRAILGSRSGASKRLKKRAASMDGALLPLFVAPKRVEPFISKELLHHLVLIQSSPSH